MQRQQVSLETLEKRIVLDSTVVFNEVMYNPVDSDNAGTEWIELYNQLVVDMDISDWSLEGGVDYTFPDGTIVPGRGHLVIAADPAKFEQQTGITGALGPFTGQLSNKGEELRLYNNDSRLMNSLNYSDRGEWPSAPDGSGVTLAKRDQLTASHVATNWTFSPQIGGTPGSDNFVPPGSFRDVEIIGEMAPVRAFVPTDDSLGTAWTGLNFDDSLWVAGTNGVGYDTRNDYDQFLGLDLDAPPNDQAPTPMREVNGSAYIRIPFQFDGDTSEFSRLNLAMRYDDGMVVYLNGVEVVSANAPGRNGEAGELAWNSTATRSHSDRLAVVFDNFDISEHTDLLRQGENVLAIHGLNRTVTDSDFLMQPVLAGQIEVLPEDNVPLALNEVSAASATVFFAEIVNQGTEPVDLTGMVLRTTAGNGPKYTFGATSLGPGELLAVDQNELGFRPADNDRLLLLSAGEERLIDGRRVANRLRGLSDRYPGQWLYPAAPTPSGPNAFQFQDDIVINEIMYHPYPELSIPDTPPQFERTALVEMTSDKWRYNATGADLPADWASQTHDVDGQQWVQGQGLIGFETSSLAFPINTELTRPSNNDPRFVTYYFETNFELTADDLGRIDVLELTHMIDDGAVFYLNGQEFHRFNVPSGEITSQTEAVRSTRNAEPFGPITVPKELLRVGTNVLSASVHLSTPSSGDVVFGAELTRGRQVSDLIPGRPFRERNEEEWIELYNKGTQPVDLTGWTLRDGVQFDFPAGTVVAPGEYVVLAANADFLAGKYPAIRIVGQFDGQLSDHDDRLLLIDASSNPADDVHYWEGGRWPALADGGGVSLELRDPNADNSKGESWTISDHSADSEWIQHTFRATAERDVFQRRALFNEFLFGLLAEGEFLIDDVSVIKAPAGEAQELMQNGTFEADTIGESPAKWRLIGNHSGTVIADPTNPENNVLKVVASGAQGFVHDHAETTFANNTRLEDGVEYQISFRAKWLRGNRQLNSRLWFNRLPNTVRLPVPEKTGTPGAANTALEANVGPTFAEFGHGPVAPAPDQPVEVHVRADDPQGVTSVTLWWREDRRDWTSVPMTRSDSGLYVASIPGKSSGDIVQFYVEAVDGQGAKSTFPAEGPDSRALYQVEDGQGPTTKIDKFRIILMTQEERDLFAGTNRMSNWFLPATIVHNNTPFYDVDVRLVGSRWIRPNSGYKVRLDPANAFNGVHDSIRFDMNGMAEIVMKQMLNRAGGAKSSNYDDISYLISPNRSHTHEIILQLARYETVYLAEQFVNGSDGTKFELDDVTVPTQPQGGVEGLKTGTDVNTGADIGVNSSTARRQGTDPEFYRAHLLIKSNREKDDYQGIVQLAQAIHKDGDELFEATNEIMDVDIWMRHYANQSYFGNWDTYGFRRPKNLRIYRRPSDGRFLPLFWDCDLCNFSEPIKTRREGTSRLDEIRDIPHNLRLYWGHMLDLINRSFNEEYVARWAAHYGALANGQTHGGDETFSGITNSTRTRSARALADLERDIPRVDFQITTNDGQDMQVDTPVVTLEGKGWVDIRQIRLAGTTTPLDVFWPESDGWQLQIPLNDGPNEIVLEAIDYQGNLITTDSLTVNSTVGNPTSRYLRVSEVHYNPAPATTAEINAGFNDGDDFEFIELTNIGDQPIPLDSAALIRIPDGNDDVGVDFSFADGAVRELGPGEQVVVVEDVAAFRFRYGESPRVAGQWRGGLSDAGETVTVTVNGAELQQFTYDDAWYPETDGAGRSLQVVNPAEPDLSQWNKPGQWRPSGVIGGTPGLAEPLPGDANGDGTFNSNDLLAILGSGEYEDDQPGNSTFAEGDFNGDGDFTTKDLVWVFKYGSYQSGALAARPAISHAIVTPVSPGPFVQPLLPGATIRSIDALSDSRTHRKRGRRIGTSAFSQGPIDRRQIIVDPLVSDSIFREPARPVDGQIDGQEPLDAVAVDVDRAWRL